MMILQYMVLSPTQAVDACAEKNGGCSDHAVCKRTVPGRRICMCLPGYAGDGKVCVCKCAFNTQFEG